MSNHVKEEVPSKKRTEYRSCKRTTADEEYLLLKMEFLFLLLGILSTTTARLLKKRSVNLFDQRWSKKVRQSSLAFTFQPGMLDVDGDPSSKGNINGDHRESNHREIEPLVNRNKQTLHSRINSAGRLIDIDLIRDGETKLKSSSDHGRKEVEMV